jgi:hypothetical protein
MTPNPDSDDHQVEPPPWSISIRASRRLFWSHAVLIASKGTASRIGSLSAEWERFFEWERIAREDEPRQSRWRPGGRRFPFGTPSVDNANDL